MVTKKPPERLSSSEYWYNSLKETDIGQVPRGHSDNHLRWHAHIDKVRKNCLGKIAAIRRVSQYLPSHIKRTLYLSFILPHLKYYSVVWGNYGTTLSHRLERVQNYALRIIMNKPPRSNTEEMRSQLSLPPLSSRREATVILQVRRCLQETPSTPTISPTRGAKDLHLI